MEITELLHESLSSLTVNKIRTGLATLGVVIGIGSVIALVSLGQASQKLVTDRITSLGTNLLTVRPGFSSSSGIRGGFGSASSLTTDDVKILESSPFITTIQAVSAESSGNGQLVAGRNNMNTTIIGVTPAYSVVNNSSVQSGSFITSSHLTSMSRVAVIGPNVVSELFGENINPIGQTLRINSQAFTIIGITQAKGGSGRFNQDDQVFIPLTTAQNLIFGDDSLSTISLAATDPEVMDLARNQVTQVLLQKHRISDPAQADFEIFSQEDLLGTISEVTGTFTTLLSGIAAISLVVGGIGIMNIMLVTVTERTREIGLRKALGAKKAHIITQFLLEAIIITLLGGLIGMVVGVAISGLITHFMSLPFTISPISIVLAVGVSAIIGLVFGWYPARKAANLQPIEALRYE